MAKNSKKGCIYSFVGCSVLAVAGIAVAGYFLYQQAKTIQENLENPEPRTLEMLGLESMPEGYYANFAFSIPFIMDMVIMSNEDGSLANSEGKKQDPFGKMGFFYFKFLKIGKDSADLQNYFEGKTDNDKVLRENGVNIDVDEVLKRGVFTLNGNQVYYLSQRGSISSNGANANGLNTLMLIQCPNDKKMRLGIWYGPDSQNDVEDTSGNTNDDLNASLEGTVADLNEVQAFMEQFSFCEK